MTVGRLWKGLAMILAAAMLWSCALPEGEGTASSVPNGPEPGALEDILRELRQAVPEPEEELRGVWIAYLDLVPLLREKSEDQFTEGFSAMAESCREAGFNALVVQVRPFGDSFYPSAYFSWSALTGPLAYDPMAIMTRIAAEKDLEFHAWLNPMRAMTLEEAAAVPEEFPIRQWYDDPALRAERLILLDGRVYLNPASAEVRALIADGAAELAERYSIDGVHIDDYFYPPKLDFSVDGAAYDAYCAGGGTLSQGDWRRENTFRMVRELSAAVKAADPSVQFGVSPRGQMSQNLEDLYIDLERLAGEPGCLDYLAPQLYYGFRNTAAPFSALAEEWNRLAEGHGIRLVVGLAAYKIGRQDAYAEEGQSEWLEDPELLAKEIRASRELSAYGGVMLFRYGSVFQPDPAYASAVEEARETFLPALSEEILP